MKTSFAAHLRDWQDAREATRGAVAQMESEGGGGTAVAARPETEVSDGAVVIAAITSCTNTSNPSVMVGAGLLAKTRDRAWPAHEAVGEDEPCAGLESRHRLPEQSGLAAVSRPARLQPRRLRLHDLHRQQRSAARSRRERGRRERHDRGRGALRQSQLRRPHPRASPGQLSRLAPARSRVCARRPDGRRPDDRADRLRRRGRSGVPARHLAFEQRDRADDLDRHRRADVPLALQRRVQGRRRVARARGPDRRPLTRGTKSRST